MQVVKNYRFGAGGVAQVVEYLSSKHEALSTTKKKERKKRKNLQV
jgi:hypothetical protein